MRKSFRTKEYSLEHIKGTMNMKEQKSFFMSKILEIEDVINISNINLVWTESSDQSQNLKSENINNKYNSISHKEINHSINFAPLQSDLDIKNYTSWNIKINIKDILKEYLYAQLKKNRVFAYIQPEYTVKKDIKQSILEYIEYNVMPRIEFNRIDLYVKYYPIVNENLQYQNVYKYDSDILTYKADNYRLVTDSFYNEAVITYKQIYSSQDYMFNYYFDVIWKKS